MPTQMPSTGTPWPADQFRQGLAHARLVQALQRMVEAPHTRQYHSGGASKIRGRASYARLDVQLLVDIRERQDVAEAVVDDDDHRIGTFWTRNASSLIPTRPS